MTIASIEERLERARTFAAKGNLVVVRDDGEFLILPALAKSAARPGNVAAVERMMPSTVKRNVAVIGDTSWAIDRHRSVQTANMAIPFFGLLMGLSCIGHSVWVFHGTANMLSAGCRGADVLIVDSALVVELPDNWQVEAKKTMRHPQILIHDRATYKLQSA
jgi:hypothetical protein